jgi:hypothetical protein
LLAFEIAELLVGIAFLAFEQELVAGAIGIDLPQLVGPRIDRADLAHVIAMDAAPAPLPRIDDNRAVRGEHRIDVHFRRGELGFGAVALDDDIAGIAIDLRARVLGRSGARQSAWQHDGNGHNEQAVTLHR